MKLYKIMKRTKQYKNNKKIIETFVSITSSITFVVLGVIILAFAFIAGTRSNLILYIGELLTILGIIDYVFAQRKEGK